VTGVNASVISDDLIPPGTYTAQELHNRATVLEFYDLVVNQRDLKAALRLVGERYIQHDPRVPDGTQGLIDHVSKVASAFPELKVDVKRVFVEGDLVVLHVRSRNSPSPNGDAGVDIFRLENGKIVEHWDVICPIPDQAANPNSMF
jgi:predicted SnoaL-like aldol condensation-catalyzing enzyme